MPTSLDYQSTPALTPAQKRAAAHLLAWAIALWVAAAGIGLVILDESMDALSQLTHGTAGSVVFRATIGIIIVATLPTYGLWRVGRILMRARRGLPAHQPGVLTDSIGVLDVFQLITLIAIAVSLAMTGIPLFSATPDYAFRYTDLLAPTIAIAVTAALMATIVWSRRQFRKVEKELLHAAPDESHLPP